MAPRKGFLSIRKCLYTDFEARRVGFNEMTDEIICIITGLLIVDSAYVERRRKEEGFSTVEAVSSSCMSPIGGKHIRGIIRRVSLVNKAFSVITGNRQAVTLLRIPQMTMSKVVFSVEGEKGMNLSLCANDVDGFADATEKYKLCTEDDFIFQKEVRDRLKFFNKHELDAEALSTDPKMHKTWCLAVFCSAQNSLVSAVGEAMKGMQTTRFMFGTNYYREIVEADAFDFGLSKQKRKLVIHRKHLYDFDEHQSTWGQVACHEMIGGQWVLDWKSSKARGSPVNILLGEEPK